MTGKPRVFWLHFNRFMAKKAAQDVWTVHLSDRCLHAKKVHVQVPVETIYKGDTAPQPRAFLKGKGIVRQNKDGTISIT